MKKLTLLLLIFCVTQVSIAQNVTTPPASPKASVSEWIGLTKITIDYSRPGVKERKVAGNLIPYNGGTPLPWRAGANENTTITFENDVKIEGQNLAAGKYGFHVIADKAEWTLIFSKDNAAWGSYSYDAKNDALRVKIKPGSGTHQEWLRYQFVDQTPNSAKIELAWAKIRAGFSVEVDVHEITLANIRKELTGVDRFSWQSWNSAAAYCLANDVNLEEGLEWAEYSINGGFRPQVSFTTLSTKAMILDKLNKADESKKTMDKALTLATMTEMHFYGRQLIQQKKPKEALAIFEKNRKNNPEDKFTTLVGLARGNQAVGKNKEAAKYFKMAAENAPVGQKDGYLDLAKQAEEKDRS